MAGREPRRRAEPERPRPRRGRKSIAQWTPGDLQSRASSPWRGLARQVRGVPVHGVPVGMPYCHSWRSSTRASRSVVAWSKLEDLLARRRGVLDGVVFSGGEADLRSLGAGWLACAGSGGVGLHTAGPYPRRLADLLGAGLVDWWAST